MNNQSAFQSNLLGLTGLALIATMLLGFMSPLPSGRCSGVGSGSGEMAMLTCSGTCTSCPTVKTLPNENKVCSCVDGQGPACCHVELENPGTGEAAFVSGGDCPSCNTVGVCTVLTFAGQTQATCLLPHE